MTRDEDLADEEPVEGGVAAGKPGEGSAEGEFMGAAVGNEVRRSSADCGIRRSAEGDQLRRSAAESGVRGSVAVLESRGTAVVEAWGTTALERQTSLL